MGLSVKETVVICLLTDSAAEEAGLQIGDVVLSVNGTEVTSVEHAEAVHLAKKGEWGSYRLQSSAKMLRAQYRGILNMRTSSVYRGMPLTLYDQHHVLP